MSLTRIGSIGINTGIAFAGVTTIVTLNTANDALSIGATVNVGSGITLGASGDIFATGISTVGKSVFLSGQNPNIRFDDSDTTNNGEITLDNSQLRIEVDEDDSRDSSAIVFRVDGSDQVTINSSGNVTATSFTGDLTGDVTGSISGGTVAGSTGTFTTGITTSLRTNKISVGDNEFINVGLGSDVQLYWTGSAGFLTNQGGGNLHVNSDTVLIKNAANSKSYIRAYNNSSVELYYDNSKKFETTSYGSLVTGRLNTTGNIAMPDNAQIHIGDASDLAIYHDGSNSYILNDTGNLILKDLTDAVYIQAPSIIFQDETTNENIARFISDGACELYHDNSKRLETFDLGIDIGVNATGNYGIRWGGANFNYANIWTEYGSGDIFIAGGLKQKGTSAGFFSSYGASLSRNAIQIDSFGNEGIHFYASAAQNVTKDDAITVPERVRINQHGLTFNGDSAATNALDDYEEGTHVSTVTLGTGSITNDYGSTLNYTKIGRFVHVTGRIYKTHSVTDVSTYQFSLPFACSSGGNAVESGGMLKVFRANEVSGEQAAGMRPYRIESGNSFAILVSNTTANGGNFGTTNPHIIVNVKYIADT